MTIDNNTYNIFCSSIIKLSIIFSSDLSGWLIKVVYQHSTEVVYLNPHISDAFKFKLNWQRFVILPKIVVISWHSNFLHQNKLKPNMAIYVGSEVKHQRLINQLFSGNDTFREQQSDWISIDHFTKLVSYSVYHYIHTSLKSFHIVFWDDAQTQKVTYYVLKWPLTCINSPRFSRIPWTPYSWQTDFITVAVLEDKDFAWMASTKFFTQNRWQWACKQNIIIHQWKKR